MEEQEKNIHPGTQEQLPVTEKINPEEGKGKPKKSLSPEEIAKQKKLLFYPLIFLLFLIVMYIIFSPSKKDKEEKEGGQGINMTIPEVSGIELPNDKETAYEQASREENETERLSAMGALSDFFPETQETDNVGEEWGTIDEPTSGNTTQSSIGQSASAYRDIRHTLDNFYEDNSQYDALQQQIDELQAQLDARDTQQEENDEMERQLELMEKSYEMAARYLPQGANTSASPFATAIERPMEEIPNAHEKARSSSENAFSVLPDNKTIVSSLWQDTPDSVFIAEQLQERNDGFITVSEAVDDNLRKNTLKVVVHETATLKDGETIRLRLLESARVAGMTIPRNTLLTATAKIQGNRLSLSVTNIEYREQIIAVNLLAYDSDGQPGVFIPNSLEVNAAKEIAAGMGQSAGTSFTFSSSAGQQIAADAGRELMQGVSQFFGNKMREVKVTLKTGYQLFLVQNRQ
ncbi:conjugative transposon protein TraM [Proteiniphilum sp. UBA5346]|uniref:conjugative transposon protein TraM n=1 Tax=Proteiniphilum sp. UBA5346 TaxID=1947277 RepID=UPI00257D0F6C|nr:conjugative transposon protein TraM [Proteiniphilum sp. UBA5346]